MGSINLSIPLEQRRGHWIPKNALEKILLDGRILYYSPRYKECILYKSIDDTSGLIVEKFIFPTEESLYNKIQDYEKQGFDNHQKKIERLKNHKLKVGDVVGKAGSPYESLDTTIFFQVVAYDFDDHVVLKKLDTMTSVGEDGFTYVSPIVSKMAVFDIKGLPTKRVYDLVKVDMGSYFVNKIDRTQQKVEGTSITVDIYKSFLFSNEVGNYR